MCCVLVFHASAMFAHLTTDLRPRHALLRILARITTPLHHLLSSQLETPRTGEVCICTNDGSAMVDKTTPLVAVIVDPLLMGA